MTTTAHVTAGPAPAAPAQPEPLEPSPDLLDALLGSALGVVDGLLRTVGGLLEPVLGGSLLGGGLPI